MTKHEKVREPLFHIVKRGGIVWWKSWLVRVIAVVLALVVSGVVSFVITGENPIKIYSTMIDGAFGSSHRIWNLLHSLAMLLCVSLAVTPAFKMRFWNIGAEGQALMGGFIAAACMLKLTGVIPNYLMIPVMLALSIVVGALWGVLPAIFKAHWGTNETLFTLMMNYIATQIIAYYVYIEGGGSNVINPVPYGNFPVVGDNEYFVNTIIVAAITVLMYIYLKNSKQGYEISVVGESQSTARYIGINVKKVIIRTMLISGALCGITGMLLVSGKTHSINVNLVGGQGFTAILISWLGQFNPFIMVIMTAIVIFLRLGVAKVADSCYLNSSFSEIMVGIVILMLVGCEFFIHYSIKFRNNKKEVNA